MKPCLSLAASYSAFSDRSPCARASEIAWITAWRSTVFSAQQLLRAGVLGTPTGEWYIVAMFDESVNSKCKQRRRKAGPGIGVHRS